MNLLNISVVAMGVTLAGCCTCDSCSSRLEPMKWADNAFASGVWTQDAEGVLTASKDTAIWSAADYENFVLDFDYKLDPAANSGVIIYCSDMKKWIPNSVEIQLLDDNHGKWRKAAANWKNGGLFGHLAPIASPAKPAGEWNHMTVVARGQHIVVKVNGVTTADADLAQWTSAKTNPDGSRIPPWLNRPWADLAPKGRIGLQGLHGGARPYFRNVKVGPLE